MPGRQGLLGDLGRAVWVPPPCTELPLLATPVHQVSPPPPGDPRDPAPQSLAERCGVPGPQNLGDDHVRGFLLPDSGVCSQRLTGSEAAGHRGPLRAGRGGARLQGSALQPSTETQQGTGGHAPPRRPTVSRSGVTGPPATLALPMPSTAPLRASSPSFHVTLSLRNCHSPWPWVPAGPWHLSGNELI